MHIGDPEILQITGEISIALWMNAPIPIDDPERLWYNMVVKGHAGGSEIVMRLEGTDTERNPTTDYYVQIGTYSGGDHSVQAAWEDIDTWSHWAGTYNGTDQLWRLYRNGELVAVSDEVDPAGAVKVPAPWALGGVAMESEVYPSDRYFIGMLDDVRMYDVCLTDQEIKDIYDDTFTVLRPTANNNIPKTFNLSQNYPNPFNPETKISFSLTTNNHTSLTVHNALGQVISTLINEELRAGIYQVSFNAGDLPSGLYFYEIRSGEFTQAHKMILAK